MAAWAAWLDGVGDSLLDPGSYAERNVIVTPAGVDEGGSSNPVTGYSLLEADTLDQAVAATARCPIFDAGGTIEVIELGVM